MVVAVVVLLGTYFFEASAPVLGVIEVIGCGALAAMGMRIDGCMVIWFDLLVGRFNR